MAEKKNGIVRSGGNGRRSTTVSYNGLVYVSSITTVVLEGDMRAQAADVFGQIDRLLAGAGTDKHRLLNVTVTLRSIDEYSEFNAAWDVWVNDGFEPTICVTEGRLPLPEYRVAVSAVAAL